MKLRPTFILSIIIVLVATLKPSTGKSSFDFLFQLDKVIHFSIFAFMAYQALHNLINKKNTTEVIIACILVGLLTEILQQFIPGRNMDLYDGVANTLGIAAAYFAYKKRYLLSKEKI